MRSLILYILIICSNISIAQYINYKDDSGWNLGLNIGGSWQEQKNIQIIMILLTAHHLQALLEDLLLGSLFMRRRSFSLLI